MSTARTKKRPSKKMIYAVVQSMERGSGRVISRHNTRVAAQAAIVKAERSLYRRNKSYGGSAHAGSDRFVMRVPASAKRGSFVSMRF